MSSLGAFIALSVSVSTRTALKCDTFTKCGYMAFPWMMVWLFSLWSLVSLSDSVMILLFSVHVSIVRFSLIYERPRLTSIFGCGSAKWILIKGFFYILLLLFFFFFFFLGGGGILYACLSQWQKNSYGKFGSLCFRNELLFVSTPFWYPFAVEEEEK